MMTTKTTTDAIADLPGALDLAAFEQLPGGLFRPVGHLPSWLAAPANNNEIDLCELFPMLEMFLPEWDPVWQGTSDIWTERDSQGRDQYVQAVATEVGGRRFLVLKT